MKKNNMPLNVTGVILLILSAVLCIGSFTFLKTCEPMEDGSWMSCHWAGQAITGVSCILAVLSIANLLIKNSGIKIGLGIGMIANGIFGAAIPGTLINTCMMEDMQCNSVTKPAVRVLGIILVVIAAVNVFFAAKDLQKDTADF